MRKISAAYGRSIMMTRNEIARILAIIAAAYPRFKVDTEGITLNVWHEMLGDLDYNLAQMAVQKLIYESPYPPVIADVRKQVVEVIEKDKTDAAMAWGEVTKAMSMYGMYKEKEALASMSEKTAKVVRAIGFREICMSEPPGVVRGQFMKMYEAFTEREKKEALLPAGFKQQMQAISGRKLKLIGGGEL